MVESLTPLPSQVLPQSLTISNAPLSQPGMDYALLRKEGIQAIATLSGTLWTDYNAHDPGITILEALCYAITDLSYRLDFEMEDLLARPDHELDQPPLFFTARQILTVNPLTTADYRKLLIDIDGVKNAWLEPIETPEPALYYDANNAKLTFSNQDLAEPVNLRGLYRVLLEPEPHYQKGDLEAIATARLHQHRNLCEDFADIRVLDFEDITVKAEIDIDADADPQTLLTQIHEAIAHHISPALPFLSLQTLLDQGKPVEDIFAGPILNHGFLDDDQLRQFDRKTELHTSDLIHIILNIPGVNIVRRITLSSSQSPEQEWALDLDPQLTPRLKSLTATATAHDIKFYKRHILCNPSLPTIPPQPSTIHPLQNPKSEVQNPQDFPLPQGTYRELSDYESIQTEFPLTYGIGEIGLPPSASAERKAQAKQLQAYLMVFDQLLANYFAQLDHVRHLFSLDTTQIQTYFAQSIAHFPGCQSILKDAYIEYLERSPETATIALDRKNRFLDHLIAQYGETFTNHSMLYPNSTLAQRVLQHKADFAADYPQVSAQRSQAFDYTRNPNQLDNLHNIPGLKRRVARLLGMESNRQFLASSTDEGFYIVEHLLLRPRQGAVTGSISSTAPDASDTNPDADTEAGADFISFAHAITEFQPALYPDIVTCTSPGHGLKTGDSITIFYSTHYSGTYTITNPQADTFEIAHEFIATDTGEWVNSNQCPDPFSFQISVVFPDWPERFRSPSIKQLLYDTLIAETPAHITLHFHWLERDRMREFETLYALWLQYLSGHAPNPTEAEAAVTRLINFLGLGSTDIPDFPALVGYMVIGDDFVVT